MGTPFNKPYNGRTSSSARLRSQPVASRNAPENRDASRQTPVVEKLQLIDFAGEGAAQ